MNIEKKHELCLECMDYVCHHNYNVLDLNDTCGVCLDSFTKENVVYLSDCYHKCCCNCVHSVQAVMENNAEQKYKDCVDSINNQIALLKNNLLGNLMNNRHNINCEINWLENNLSILKKQHIEKKLLCGLRNEIKCIICNKINTGRLLTYKDMYSICCNSILPPFSKTSESVSAYEYVEQYNKYKCRLLPTPEMLNYVKECNDLMGSVWEKEKLLNTKNNRQNLYDLLHRKYK